ncbi:response regulator [Starkeya koreensis]|uniref:histidine kinase n=1 Tax=Ancylobacter koreensis TaxID=266121 RepID=A0ABT0DIL9_9HYPH|nr:response regulator [Ancylobacter koreensis]MCK0207130.1 response regulator [Ancylobacter koreensis]
MGPVSFLLVDDLEENLLSLEALLRRDGLVLLKARSGDQALEILLRNEVALALVDVQMPGLNGFDLAELMRGSDRTRRIPIIFITAGTADSQRRFRGYEAGAVDFIQKPIEPDILRSKTDVFFDLYRQRQQIAAQRDTLEAQAEALREAGLRKDEFLASLTLDITQHKHARAQQDILLREINHRIKNLFSVTAGLIALSARSATSVDAFAADLGARLQALARAHDLTLPDLGAKPSAEATTTVATLMKAIVAPHEQAGRPRVSITGSDAPLSGSALTSLALLLHELTTNAAKYGALSSPQGELIVDIEADGDVLRLDWEERGAAVAIEAPAREGFGTVLEKAVLRGLSGTLSRDWRPAGLSLSLQIPLGRLVG